MHHREMRGVVRVRKVRIISKELIGRKHALVDNDAAREARNIEEAVAVVRLAADRVGRLLADDEEFAVEGFGRKIGGSRSDEEHFHYRLARDCRRTEALVGCRHAAPAEEFLAVLGDYFFNVRLACGALAILFREEYDTGGIRAFGGQRNAGIFFCDLNEKLMGKSGQNTRAVAGIHFGASGSAMIHATQNVSGIFYDRMISLTLDVRQKTDAAVFLFAGWIIQSVWSRSFYKRHLCLLVPGIGNSGNASDAIRTGHEDTIVRERLCSRTPCPVFGLKSLHITVLLQIIRVVRDGTVQLEFVLKDFHLSSIF